MASTNIKKNNDGYGYKYADLAETNNYLESVGIRYYQFIEREDGDDYIWTAPIIDGKELPPRRGCRVVQATLNGKSNPAQEQGSALTYARRYSLWMAFGLATTDDDAQLCTVSEAVAQDEVLTQVIENIKKCSKDYQNNVMNHYGLKKLEDMTREQADDYKLQCNKKKENKNNE